MNFSILNMRILILFEYYPYYQKSILLTKSKIDFLFTFLGIEKNLFLPIDSSAFSDDDDEDENEEEEDEDEDED